MGFQSPYIKWRYGTGQNRTQCKEEPGNFINPYPANVEYRVS
jgi:hypothetical protein